MYIPYEEVKSSNQSSRIMQEEREFTNNFEEEKEPSSSVHSLLQKGCYQLNEAPDDHLLEL
jgi:hypothetical protein